MMILGDTVEINIVGKTINYWKNLGYNAVINEKCLVKISDLQKSSGVFVPCKCDSCDRKYSQRVYRNTSICGDCILRTRMSGNRLGAKNIKYDVPSKEELIENFNKLGTKLALAKYYGITIPVINRWFKEHDINIAPRFGQLYYKSEDELQKDIDSIISSYKLKKRSVASLAKSVDIPRHIIYKLKREGHIEIKSQMDNWKEEYSRICNNIDFYVKENHKKSLKTISIENNISVEHLKRAFHETNNIIRLHSYNKSKGELEVRDYVQSLGFDCLSANFNKTCEIDCFVKSKNFGIEYCGEYWHRYDPTKNNKNYHKNKLEFFLAKDIDLMTIFESEWKNKRDIIQSMISSRLGMNIKIHARKCEIKEISSEESYEFHEKYHISGGLRSSINIGIFRDNELISVLSFVKSRFDKNFQYEISRFSTRFNTTVVGGLSRMFNFFVKKYDPESCMTYADLRFGRGRSYEKIGFTFHSHTVPNYFYFAKGGDELEHRMKYQKSKLIHYKEYSLDKTEYEIMTDRNYFRIYDCGNNKYVWYRK